jgi:twitching motility protein PilJ
MPKAGREPGAGLLPMLLSAGLALLVIAAGLLLLAARLQSGQQEYLRHVAELTRMTATLPGEAIQVVRGDTAAIALFEESRNTLQRVQDEAEAGRGPFDALSTESSRRFADSAELKKLLDATEAVLAGREAAGGVASAAAEARTALGRVLASTGDAVAAPGGDAAMRALPRFEAAAQRLSEDLQALGAGSGDAAALAARINEGAATLNQFLAGLAGEDAAAGVPALTGQAAAQLAAARLAQLDLEQRLRAALEGAERAAAAQAAANGLAGLARAAGDSLAAPVADSAAMRVLAGPYPALAAVALGIVVFALALAAWVSGSSGRKAAEKQAKQSQRNQEAILRLLDEMSSLADGDLTVQATVTDDITGAIADAINYAIEALRELVITINDTAMQLDSAARQTQAAAGHLAKASVAESRQVAAATDAVSAMASSIEEVSGNAERCADVARHAVDVSHKGADAVRRTIDGMNAIRENIQDTSKRIKRLGESSQEIGNIVELINDIAEQTNILALNASIQASMAGESGRGFAVVADEVQRLAERAGHATRQIEVLVRTIQSDTNEAVVSMERTTTDVVGGALLAENAGAALGEIEDVSNQIAQLVQNISGSARQQAATSQHISRTMQVLREISQQTADNTRATSGAIGRLAELSTLLRKSVTGFRLPQEAPRASAARPAAAPAAAAAPEPPPRRVGAAGG